jgi:hypothetical protein
LFRNGFDRMTELPKLAPAPSPAEMEALIGRAGLVLNPGQVADLVLAWRQVASLLAEIPRERTLADDQAYAFRLSPAPTPAPAIAPPRKAAPPPKAGASSRAAKRRVGSAAAKRAQPGR